MTTRLRKAVLVSLFVVNYSGLNGWAEGVEMCSNPDEVSENLYQGDLISYPGPYAFYLPKSHIILVSDQELEDLSDPDKALNLALTYDKNEKSLRQICEEGKAGGVRTLIFAFDHFFKQYRPGQDQPRRLTPDMDEYVKRMASISKFAQQYGMGLELSFLSPLEIGKSFQQATGESGIWMHYRKGLRDPKTGAYSVQLWRQQQWSNNKGPIRIEDGGVRVFAFSETPVRGTPYRVVPPDSIKEISETAHVEVSEGLVIDHGGNFSAQRISVYGEGKTDIGNLNRVLIVQVYRTPEMDYFSHKAEPFLRSLIDKYADAGVMLNGLYSDEMHIQQDWSYFSHHDAGEFAVRYVSDGFRNKFAEAYGEQYRDFAKYLVYFTYGQEDFANDLSAKAGIMHVFGSSPEEIQQTALFRSRYYRFLQDGVVDLFAGAKRYAEKRMGHKLEARAHATWAESPTIDKWETGKQPEAPHQYEYTSNFVWSDTVHQAASACCDYFKWGDYLTGNGNDHPEGGWLDRDYFALALACSTGILNDVPYSYCGHWGMPNEIGVMRSQLVNTYGAAGSPLFGIVQDMQHRDVEVLMLYPIDLVAVEERFGSWMTQYGYANYVTQSKLLERGKVVNGAIEMADRRFTALVTLFEPFPSEKLLSLMKELAEQGGRVVWSGPPPVLSREGEPICSEWNTLFGVEFTPDQTNGLIAPGVEVRFSGALGSVPPQTILTDFLVDRIYPVTLKEGTAVVAQAKDDFVGTYRTTRKGGSLTFLGFRPRDDQSRSLGYETRTWFEVLNALGAYPPTGVFPEAQDNPEYLSRTTDYLVCRFPNGAVAITPHLKGIEETWHGGFARDQKRDEEYIKDHPLPTFDVHLSDFKVAGHTVTYDGRGAMSFRVDAEGTLVAFAGGACKGITIDGRQTSFTNDNLGQFAFAPVPANRRVKGGAVMLCIAYGTGALRLPARNLPENLELVAEGPTPGSRGANVPIKRAGDMIEFAVTPAISGRWLYFVLAR